MNKHTQAAQLVAAIRKSKARGMTYGELQALRHPNGDPVSTCAHKRLEEAAHRYLRPHESLIRSARRDGLVAFKIVRKYTNWTA